MRKKLSDDAKTDIREVGQYTLRQWGTQQSKKYINSIKEMIKSIADNPYIGVNRDDILPGVMMFPIGHHIIYYLVHHKTVIILRVLNRLLSKEGRVRNTKIPD